MSPVVSREGDGEDVLGVSDEPAGGAAGLDLPQSEGSVPRPRPGARKRMPPPLFSVLNTVVVVSFSVDQFLKLRLPVVLR